MTIIRHRKKVALTKCHNIYNYYGGYKKLDTEMFELEAEMAVFCN